MMTSSPTSKGPRSYWLIGRPRPSTMTGGPGGTRTDGWVRPEKLILIILPLKNFSHLPAPFSVFQRQQFRSKVAKIIQKNYHIIINFMTMKKWVGKESRKKKCAVLDCSKSSSMRGKVRKVCRKVLNVYD